jgi:hypothetical protein
VSPEHGGGLVLGTPVAGVRPRAARHGERVPGFRPLLERRQLFVGVLLHRHGLVVELIEVRPAAAAGVEPAQVGRVALNAEQ